MSCVHAHDSSRQAPGIILCYDYFPSYTTVITLLVSRSKPGRLEDPDWGWLGGHGIGMFGRA